MTKEKNIESDSLNYPISIILFIGAFLVQIIIPAVARGLSLPEYFSIFFSVALSVLFFIEFHKKYTNILLFSTLTFLLTCVFPLFHFLVYKHNNNNYFFEKYYLDYNAAQSRNQAAKYNDIPYLDHFLKTSSDSILSLHPTQLSLENQVTTDSIIIISSTVKSENTKRPGDNESAISLYTKKWHPINFVRIKGAKTLREVIENRFTEFNNISNQIVAPDKNIMMNDFWVESITGFSFSYIKPLSNMARFIRIIQLITAFILITMLLNTMNLSKKFLLEKK